MKRTVFVDTSCWVGFFLSKDQHHEEAVRTLDQLEDEGRQLVTTDYVIAETVTRLRKQGGLKIAVQAWVELEEGGQVEVVEVEKADRRQARDILLKYAQHVLSLTDCVSFIIMRKLGIAEAATFDEDFRRAGFPVLPRRAN